MAASIQTISTSTRLRDKDIRHSSRGIQNRILLKYAEKQPDLAAPATTTPKVPKIQGNHDDQLLLGKWAVTGAAGYRALDI